MSDATIFLARGLPLLVDWNPLQEVNNSIRADSGMMPDVRIACVARVRRASEELVQELSEADEATCSSTISSVKSSTSTTRTTVVREVNYELRDASLLELLERALDVGLEPVEIVRLE